MKQQSFSPDMAFFRGKFRIDVARSPHALVDLIGRYDFSKQLTATLNVNNLFNRKYLSTLDQTFYTGYYGAPRNAMLNLRYSF
ncbi:TonB-dependent receptor [Alcaligenes aquatilis]|uniref:TonB-dependent receptor n=1 Tax=Alcaligenes aquatilis TaxID=323284 RepID=UPI00193A5F56|nr:TonB-dependent receptor [Alcaligenes aquatilis]